VNGQFNLQAPKNLGTPKRTAKMIVHIVHEVGYTRLCLHHDTRLLS
jgi:hypothetical protein